MPPTRWHAALSGCVPGILAVCCSLSACARSKPEGEVSRGATARKRANQLRGQINRLAKENAYVGSTVTVEVNPHGTSQYCSRCGAKGERFSYRSGQRIQEKWGKLCVCPVCHYEANADFNASVNVHRSFYREWHWQIRKKPPPRAAKRSSGGDPLSPATGRREEACGGTPS